MKLFFAIIALAAAPLCLAHTEAPPAPAQSLDFAFEDSAASAALQISAPYQDDAGNLFSFLALSGVLAVGMVNVRTLRDTNLASTKALPAANASNNSDALDLAHVNPGRIVEGPELLVELPATPTLANATTVTLKVQDSADNVTFADVADLPSIVATGAGGIGSAALSRQFKMPIGLKRYVRLNQAVLTGAGDQTAISSTLSLVF